MHLTGISSILPSFEGFCQIAKGVRQELKVVVALDHFYGCWGVPQRVKKELKELEILYRTFWCVLLSSCGILWVPMVDKGKEFLIPNLSKTDLIKFIYSDG